MNSPKQLLIIGIISAFLLALSGCAAKVGSEQWCADMKSKPKVIGRLTKRLILRNTVF